MTNEYPHTDEIKSVLKDKADFVQRNGLNYLIPNWIRFADKYADTEDLIYEWLNDLDTRKIIDEILDTLPKNERIKIEIDLNSIDNTVIEKTFEVNECVWGQKVEKDNNYNRRKHWYYYRMNQNVFDSETGQFTKRL
jgi:hypothetical protein